MVSVLDFLYKVQGDPSGAGLQLAPEGSTGTFAFFHDGKDTLSGETTCPCIVCSGAFADVQIADGHLHKVRLEGFCLFGDLGFGFNGIDSIAIGVKNKSAGVLVRSLLRILQHLVSTDMALLLLKTQT